MASQVHFYFLTLSILYQIQFLFLGRGLLKPIKPIKEKGFINTEPALLIVHHNDFSALEESLSHFHQVNTQARIKVYVLDDHSNQEVVQKLTILCDIFKAELIASEADRGKKKALAWFLPQIKEDYIIQIDADCKVDENFLPANLKVISTCSPDLIIGQVRMKPQSNIWSKLAALDHLSLQLVTFSALKQNVVLMAAGASMAYRRESFLEYLSVGMEWAGGEDTFVAQAMAKDKKSIVPLPSAVVYTDAPKDFKHFIKQRLRWGAKSQAYPSKLAQALAINVALLNLSIVLGTVLSAFLPVSSFLWTLFLYKVVADALLLYRYTELYGGAKLLQSYLILALLYPVYISIVVLLLPFSAKGKWLASS